MSRPYLLDLSSFNRCNVTDMNVCLVDVVVLDHLIYPHLIQVMLQVCIIFYRCNNLSSLNLSTFNTSYIRDIYCLFKDILILLHFIYSCLILKY